MGIIREKSEKFMYAEEKGDYPVSGPVLSFFSVIYGVIAEIRNVFYNRNIFRIGRLSCKVISIGNITVGGTGKTPMAILLAGMLAGLGYKVVIVSRGYGGKAEKEGGLVSDGKKLLMEPGYSGDEPFMMAARLNDVPVVVGQNRYRAGELAIKSFNPDVILLDDGFQHRKLFRDVDILLLDSERPFGNGRVLPAGILRESVDSLKRADAIILTRSLHDNTTVRENVKSVSEKQPVFEAYNTSYFFRLAKAGLTDSASAFRKELSDDLTLFAGKKIVAFSGIAGNDNFRKTLSDSGCDPAAFYGFPDHHRYSVKDMAMIHDAVKDKNVEFVMTTEKDFARMGGRFDFPAELVVVGVKMRMKDENSFRKFILSKL